MTKWYQYRDTLTSRYTFLRVFCEHLQIVSYFITAYEDMGSEDAEGAAGKQIKKFSSFWVCWREYFLCFIYIFKIYIEIFKSALPFQVASANCKLKVTKENIRFFQGPHQTETTKDAAHNIIAHITCVLIKITAPQCKMPSTSLTVLLLNVT